MVLSPPMTRATTIWRIVGRSPLHCFCHAFCSVLGPRSFRSSVLGPSYVCIVQVLSDSTVCICFIHFVCCACCREAMGHETDRCDYGTSSDRSLSGLGCALPFVFVPSRLTHANMLCVFPVLPMRTCCAGSIHLKVLTSMLSDLTVCISCVYHHLPPS